MSILIEKVAMLCPLCGKEHEVERRKGKETDFHQGKEFSYDVEFLRCPVFGERGGNPDFEDEKMLTKNFNAMKAALDEVDPLWRKK